MVELKTQILNHGVGENTELHGENHWLYWLRHHRLIDFQTVILECFSRRSSSEAGFPIKVFGNDEESILKPKF
jgi:hypothetical protein